MTTSPTPAQPPVSHFRTSELAFRLAAPWRVDDFDVVEVVSWRAGDHSGYAGAHVVTSQDGGNRLSTHMLFWADDQNVDKGGLWFLEAGHYGFGSLADARMDARRRAGEPHLYQPATTPAAYTHLVSVPGGHSLRTYDDPTAAEHAAAMINERHGGELVAVRTVPHQDKATAIDTYVLEGMRRDALGED